MTKVIAGASVALLLPKRADLEATIRAIARRDQGGIAISDHALDQMDARSITTLDVARVLRDGDIEGEIEQGRYAGEWKCVMTKKIRGSRTTGVVTICQKGTKLYVKTVMWLDP